MAKRPRARPPSGARAYVDTSALIAFLDRSDSYHALFRRLFAEPPSLVSTPLVIAEGHGWFLKRYDRARGLQFLSFIEDLKPLRLVVVGAEEQAGAVRTLRKFSDQDLTLTDAVGIHVMKELKIRSCWSTDFHLRLTGIPLVIDQH
jgi:predicted nucleic acid-binding protein